MNPAGAGPPGQQGVGGGRLSQAVEFRQAKPGGRPVHRGRAEPEVAGHACQTPAAGDAQCAPVFFPGS